MALARKVSRPQPPAGPRGCTRGARQHGHGQLRPRDPGSRRPPWHWPTASPRTWGRTDATDGTNPQGGQRHAVTPAPRPSRVVATSGSSAHRQLPVSGMQGRPQRDAPHNGRVAHVPAPARSPGQTLEAASPPRWGWNATDRVEQEHRRVQGELRRPPHDLWATSRRSPGRWRRQVDVDRAESRGVAAARAGPCRHQRLVASGRDQDGAPVAQRTNVNISSSAGGIRCAAVSTVSAAPVAVMPRQDRDESSLTRVENVRQHAAHQREQDGGRRVRRSGQAADEPGWPRERRWTHTTGRPRSASRCLRC